MKTLLASLAAVLLAGTVAGAVKVSNGYKIVIATNCIASEKYAAEELGRYLERVTGAKFPIIGDAQKAGSKVILVGESEQLRRLHLKGDWRKLGTDGFFLRTVGNRLIIAGGKPRGTLNGVYTFLEEQVGVRWFTPELEKVPKVEKLVLPELDQTRVPALEYREVFWTEMMRDADFAARHRLNGNHYALKEKHGGRFVVYFPFVHSFDALVPPDLYGEHPDYFPLIKGERVKGYVQRCLSNPEVLKMSIARVRQWIKEHPEASIISVSQNDTGNWCQCEACKSLDDKEGTPAASLIRFVNAIAEDIEKDYPNVRIDTLAYQYTRKPPATLRPRRNVVIRLCSIECCFAHPLGTCVSEENKRFRGDIIAWEPVAPTFYVWDYTPNFAHYQQPFPNFGAIQQNVKFFVEHKVKGLFEQGNYSPGGNGELGPLRAYLLAKLLWNPDTDMERDMREFLTAYYGSAAGKVREYVALLEKQVADGKTHAHIFDSPRAKYLNEDFVRQGSAILEEAERMAGSDEQQFRVQVAQLPVMYLQLVRDGATSEEKAALLKRFLEIARKAKISNISEGQSLEDWAKKMAQK